MGLDLQARIKPHKHQVAIGVASGISFCGTVGNNIRGDSAVVGDSVNVAARLMGLSCMRQSYDGVLCEESIANSLDTSKLDVLESGSVPLKVRVAPAGHVNVCARRVAAYRGCVLTNARMPAYPRRCRLCAGEK